MAKAGTKLQEVVTISSSSVFVTAIIIHYYGKYWSVTNLAIITDIENLKGRSEIRLVINIEKKVI